MVSICLMASLVLGTGALSWAQGLPWRDHAAPFDFLFGNHIDTHQQSKLVKGELQGFLYITYTGEVVDGVPVARHCDENTLPVDCVAGWKFTGKPIDSENPELNPTFVFHNGDHPIWLVNSRNDIPQPGAFSHFHWLNDPMDEDAPMDATELSPGDTFPGFFLELFAIETFYFEHGGDRILVRPGLDIATHVNIVGSFPPPIN